jgi:23S rRNA pseudouridine2604 synthase
MSQDQDLHEPLRLSKRLSELGMCSRRDADGYIERGWVLVDGQPVTTLGTKVTRSQTVALSAQAKADQRTQFTILIHKPVSFVSGQPEPPYRPAVVLVQPENEFHQPQRATGRFGAHRQQTTGPRWHPGLLRGLAPAGRLDIDSEGLLVMTQDGRIAKHLIGENSPVEKEYLVRVGGRLSAAQMQLLNHGLELDGKPLKPAQVRWQNEDQLQFILREGRHRQIRRMCELVGLRILALKRVRIGNVRLGSLPLGQWRFLGPDEHF